MYLCVHACLYACQLKENSSRLQFPDLNIEFKLFLILIFSLYLSIYEFVSLSTHTHEMCNFPLPFYSSFSAMVLHCWNDSSSSVIPLSFSGVTLFMTSTPSKRVLLMIPLNLHGGSHMEQKQTSRGVLSVRWYSSRPGTAGCLGGCQQVQPVVK